MNFHSVDKGKQRASFKDTTLILPVVSLANVTQLACDLLIWSLNLQLVGRLPSENHIPVVAPRDYVEGQSNATGRAGVSTAVEVYQSADGKVTLIQQRSPVIKSRKDDFIAALSNFAKDEQIGRILVLTGVDAGMRQDFDNPSPFRYLITNESSFADSIKTVMTAYEPSQPTLTAERTPLMPSSGIARRLLASLTMEAPVKDVTAILIYVAEGDNRFDAHVLARCVAKVLQIQVEEEAWREPASWKLGLYGAEGLRGSAAGSSDLYG